ncbi:MAG: ferrous iron efflux protein F [Methanosaeta sp. PtaU1.Bin060]|jgi:cation diffusion facilitator family transporter|nr:MAG: ferrous iron efflux protein F [Methanosaeta sp. PtaU1.Bin060]
MAYYSTVRRVLIIIFVLNLSVGLMKGAYGLYTNSLSMAADGLHSIFDSSSNIIGLVGIAIASRPPDKEHPYGHSKFETFASIGIAALLFASCIQVVEAAVNRFLNPSFPEITYWSFAIMGATLAVNVGVAAYEYIIGRRLKSSILVADSMHTRSDVYASVGVILGFFAVRMGYPLADPIIALIITGLIILTGIEIIKESSRVLLDHALIEERVIRDLAESVDGVCNCHRIRTRGTPGEMYIDLHIGVDPSLSIEAAHKLGLAVENKIEETIDGVRDVVVHMEPKEYCEIDGSDRAI